MIEKERFDNYDDGYYVGFEEGRRRGFEDGYNEGSADTAASYEARLNRYWAELQTFNARVDYLESLLNKLP